MHGDAITWLHQDIDLDTNGFTFIFTDVWNSTDRIGALFILEIKANKTNLVSIDLCDTIIIYYDTSRMIKNEQRKERTHPTYIEWRL